jgi:iron complex transport system substrate-binding protein
VKTRLSRIFFVLILSLSIVTNLTGCTGAGPADNSGTRTVIDHLNRTVVVPANPQRVISLHPIGTEIVHCLQAQDKLIAADKMSASLSMPLILNPNLKELPAFTTTDHFNVEEIMAMKPDLVIGTAYYPEEIEKMAASGLTVIAFDFHGRTTDEEIELLGAALGKVKEADKLIEYRKKIQDKIVPIISTIPQEERKTVFYLRYSVASLLTASANTFEHELITEAGGINLGKDITQGTWVEASWEQIFVWNPQIIISAPLISTGEFLTIDDLMADSKWNKVNAIQNKNAWVMPMGYFKMDCSAPENVLGMEYLATTLYPDKFKTINFREDTKDFFKTFYHYSLSEKELDTILMQKGIQMGNN